MYTAGLAFFSPLFLSVACFFAGGVWLMLWSQQRHRYMLLSALPWWALSLYFGLLTISTNESGMLQRGDIAVGLRVLSLAAGALVLAAKFMLLRAWWRNGHDARVRARAEAANEEK